MKAGLNGWGFRKMLIWLEPCADLILPIKIFFADRKWFLFIYTYNSRSVGLNSLKLYSELMFDILILGILWEYK